VAIPGTPAPAAGFGELATLGCTWLRWTAGGGGCAPYPWPLDYRNGWYATDVVYLLCTLDFVGWRLGAVDLGLAASI